MNVHVVDIINHILNYYSIETRWNKICSALRDLLFALMKNLETNHLPKLNLERKYIRLNVCVYCTFIGSAQWNQCTMSQ